MSLVAYDASSDEESDHENEDAPKAIIVEKVALKSTTTTNCAQDEVFSNGHISDEDDDFVPATTGCAAASVSSLSQILPLPKNSTNLANVIENLSKPTFTILPAPKDVSSPQDIEEEDDEFLRKKPAEEMIEKPHKNADSKKMPVKITIPSLKNFEDVDKEMAEKAKNRMATGPIKSQKSSCLLNILPKAKSEQNFSKTTKSSGSTVIAAASRSSAVPPVTLAFVPDAVKHRRPATNTEDVDGININKKKIPIQPKPKTSLNKKLESDESDNEETDVEDFFSFNTDQNLPEVSTNEINALVAKKAAKIAETTTKYFSEAETHKSEKLERIQMEEKQLENHRKRYHQEQQLNPEALQALVGGSSKRRRQQNDDIQVIDINSEQVLPNKEEWMRTALASSTTYQPTGVLVDEEPASGTRRKHQITYLAHKAKANEAELQAMWSANRQNRRATQSKYGF